MANLNDRPAIISLEKLIEDSMPKKINFLGCTLEKLGQPDFIKYEDRENAVALISYGTDTTGDGLTVGRNDALEALLRPIAQMLDHYEGTLGIELHRESTHSMDGGSHEWIRIPMKNEGMTPPIGSTQYALEIEILGIRFWCDRPKKLDVTIAIDGKEEYMKRFVSAFEKCYSANY